MNEFDNIIARAYFKLDENKERFINKLDISAEEKEEIKYFFMKHPNLESDKTLDWNKPNIEAIRALINKTETTSRSATKHDSILLLKKNPNFTYIYSTDEWAFFYLKNREAAIFCDSFQCGGIGAKWCIGGSGQDGFNAWESMYRGSIFILAIRRDLTTPANDIKYILEKQGRDGKIVMWDQLNQLSTRTEKLSDVAEKVGLNEAEITRLFEGLTPGEYTTTVQKEYSLDEFYGIDEITLPAGELIITECGGEVDQSELFMHMNNVVENASPVYIKFKNVHIPTYYIDCSYEGQEHVCNNNIIFEDCTIDELSCFGGLDVGYGIDEIAFPEIINTSIGNITFDECAPGIQKLILEKLRKSSY